MLARTAFFLALISLLFMGGHHALWLATGTPTNLRPLDFLWILGAAAACLTVCVWGAALWSYRHSAHRLGGVATLVRLVAVPALMVLLVAQSLTAATTGA